MFVFRFRNIVDKNRQFIVKFEVKTSINLKFQLKQQLVRFEIIKSNVQFLIIIQNLFNVIVNNFMRFVRENINIKFDRLLEIHIELLKNEFRDMLKKQFIDIIEMLKFEINNVVANVFVNVFINVFINVVIIISFISFIVSKFSKFKKIKYFDFDYKQKKSYITIKSLIYNFVVNVNKYIYYIEMYVFVNKLKNFQHQY